MHHQWPAPGSERTANRNAHENYVLGSLRLLFFSTKDILSWRAISSRTKSELSRALRRRRFRWRRGHRQLAGTGLIPYSVLHHRRAPHILSRIDQHRFASASRVLEPMNLPGKLYRAGSAGTPDPLQFFGPSAGRQDGIVNITGLTGIGGALQLPFNTTSESVHRSRRHHLGSMGAHNVRFGASVSRLAKQYVYAFLRWRAMELHWPRS